MLLMTARLSGNLQGPQRLRKRETGPERASFKARLILGRPNYQHLLELKSADFDCASMCVADHNPFPFVGDSTEMVL